MFRDIFTNKWIIGGVAFLIVFAVACVFWYRYDTAPDRKSAAEAEKLLQQWAEKKAAPDDKMEQAADIVSTESENQTENTAEVTEYKGRLLRPGDIVDGRIFLGTEPPSPELLAQLGVQPRSQDEIISPYGFGPYPELPEGFGPITWPRKSANSELRIRVKIKLLNQGVPVKGSIMENGLVYPIIKGVRYVIWGESDGKQYLRRSLGHPDDGDYMRTIKKEKNARDESITAADFPGIKLVPFEEGGIDPYTFLDLPK